MSASDVVRPGRWSDAVKGAVVAALLTGAVSGTASIYSSGEFHAVTEFHLKAIDEKLVGLADGQKEAKTVAAEAASAAGSAAKAVEYTEKDLAQGRATNLPRIDRLEAAVNQIVPALAALNQKADDNLAVSRSHTPDLAAVRAVVAPREPGHGQ